MSLTKLEQELCRILDFSPQYIAIAKNEAVNKGKLQDVYMILNGELVRIIALHLSDNLVTCRNSADLDKLIEVETLEPYLPESGLYNLGHSIFSLTKLASKTWVKSFKPDNYYIKCLFTIGSTKISSYYSELTKIPVQTITMDTDGRLWLYGENTSIAYTSGLDTIKVKNPKYFQEVLDFVTRKEMKCQVTLQ